MSVSGNRLGGSRLNTIYANVMARVLEVKEHIEDQLLADGYPPFSYPLSDREMYDKLVAMRQVNDPNYLYNPEARAELTRLSQMFGPPPPPVPAEFPPFAQGERPFNL